MGEDHDIHGSLVQPERIEQESHPASIGTAVDQDPAVPVVDVRRIALPDIEIAHRYRRSGRIVHARVALNHPASATATAHPEHAVRDDAEKGECCGGDEDSAHETRISDESSRDRNTDAAASSNVDLLPRELEHGPHRRRIQSGYLHWQRVEHVFARLGLAQIQILQNAYTAVQ